MALEAVETRRFHVRITRRWITRSNLALSMYYIHFYIPDKFASLEMFDLGSKLDNFTDSFVAKHSSGRQQVSKHDIGVANTACLDLDENLVFVQCRSFVCDLFNLVVGFTANICTRFSVRVQCIIIKASSLTQWWRKLRECSPCECILCSCFWKIEKDKYVDENVRRKGKKPKLVVFILESYRDPLLWCQWSATAQPTLWCHRNWLQGLTIVFHISRSANVLSHLELQSTLV